ncbi:hypothetical protein [Enterococcus faecium]|uniref:hypothetical protein n=1 Tax=Enterococcus faecium TaxID=1352 RepID=UPI003EEB68F6
MKIDRPGIDSEGTTWEQLFAAGYALASTARFNMLEENNFGPDSEKSKHGTYLFCN